MQRALLAIALFCFLSGSLHTSLPDDERPGWTHAFDDGQAIASWSEVRGDARHNARVDFEGAMDLLGHVRYLPEGSLLHPADDQPVLSSVSHYSGPVLGSRVGLPWATWDDEFVGWARDSRDGVCMQFTLDPRTGERATTTEGECRAAWTILYQRENMVLRCRAAEAGEPMLDWYDLSTQKPAWSRSAAELAPRAEIVGAFDCGVAAWDAEKGRWYIPIRAAPRAIDGAINADASIGHLWQVVALAPSGELLWSTSDDTTELTFLEPSKATGVTLTDTMLALSMSNPNSDLMIWLSKEGEYVGYAFADGDAEIADSAGGEGPPAGFDMAVAEGRFAYSRFGSVLLGAEPPNGGRGAYVDLGGTGIMAPPVAQAGHVYYAGYYPIYRLAAPGMELTHVAKPSSTSTGGSGNAAMWATNDALHVVTTAPTILEVRDFDDLDLLSMAQSNVQGPNGQMRYEVQRRAHDFRGIHYSPSHEVMVVYSLEGDAWLFGRAPDGDVPRVAPTQAYPSLGEYVDLEVVYGGVKSVQGITVNWGDGGLVELQPNDPLAHRYSTEGIMAGHVTLQFDDGTSAGAPFTINPGLQPPQYVSLIERAFMPENYDLTFGVLGILLAVSGGLFAAVRIRRHRSRIRSELAHVDATLLESDLTPAARAEQVHALRGRARQLFLAGRLDEGQLSVVQSRIDELARGARVDTLTERFDFLPYGFVIKVREMLADGRLTSWENRLLNTLLEQDKSLAATQRKHVLKLLAEWEIEDAARQPT